MKQTDIPNIDSIYSAAIQLPPAKRSAYLDEVCEGQQEIRGRVEQLLSAQSKVGSFLESPAPEIGVTVAQPITEKPGTRIGPYKLLQKIGEGGMGVVYMAEQEKPVCRKVALKIIKPGMDSAQVVARFEAERQALAMMDHNNIAKVFEAGTTEAGRPYFIMELVHGVPITEYCDANQLTADQRLQLFVAVCQAIHHAHQKGIIHRDIKPSNVLVTMYDDKPMPKIIDFGVAKAVQQKLTERTLFTEYGALMGTFEYMSPEQAEMNAFGVDTRSDVYSLGVLLYELLTGTTPLERSRLREAAYGEIVRLIKEEEAPRPSIRLSTSGELAKVAAARQTEPTKLSSLVRGELDWIVMRCLDKDRTRRYDGASSLAKDVEHYLSGDAVEACPPTLGYQLRKFTRRHKTQVLVVSVVFLALLAGITGTTFGLIRAEQRRLEAEQARIEAVKQRELAIENARLAEAAAKREEAQRKRAEDSVERTLQVFDSMTSDDFSESLTSQRVISEEQRNLYEIAADYYRGLSEETLDDEESLVQIADAATKLANIEVALGRYDKTIEAMKISLKSRVLLASEFPANSTYRFALVLNHLGLAHFYLESNDVPNSRYHVDAVKALIERLMLKFPEEGQNLERWADIRHRLGWELTKLRNFEDAELELAKAIGLYRELVKVSPTPEIQKSLMLTLCNAGSFRPLSSGRRIEYEGRKEGFGPFTEAAKIAQDLLDSEPDDPDRLYHAARTQFLLARTSGKGNVEQGLQHYLNAQSILERLVKEYPSNIEYMSRLARTRDRMTIPLRTLGKLEDALAQIDQALVTYSQLAQDHPKVSDFIDELGRAHTSKGRVLQAQGRFAESIRSFNQAIDIATSHRSYDDFYNSTKVFKLRATSYERLQQFEKAMLDWDRVLENRDGLRDVSYDTTVGRLIAQIQLGTVSIADAVAQEEQLARNLERRFKTARSCVRFYSVASTLSGERKNEFAQKAIDEIALTGDEFSSLRELQTHPDFDPLREYPVFQQIVAQREAAAGD